MLICKQTDLSREFKPSPFIVGIARSGTTLLRMMLDAHSQLAIPPETHFIPDLAAASHAKENPRDLFVDLILAGQFWPDFQLDPATLRQRLAVIEPFDVGAGLRAFYKLYADRFGKPRWGDKTPTYLTQMRLIADLLPEACFIHLIRDGRDVALSVKNLWFGPDSIMEAAKAWTDRIRAAREQVSRVPNYIEVRYEDLVLEAEATSNRICAFLDLPWEAQILDYHRAAESRLREISRDIRGTGGKMWATADQRVSIHAQTSKPPDASRIGRWKNEMTTSDRQEFEKIAAPLLAELGYMN